MKIHKELFQYLKKLSKNNNRDWFKENKSEYDKNYQEVKSFFKAVNDELLKTDQIENFSVFRVYRDVRFSKDKSPYRARFGGYFRRATAVRRGGYVLNLEPGNSYVGGGFYGPNKNDLLRIRKEFEADDADIREILSNNTFKKTFGSLQGNELKTAPRDFDKEHVAIDLIRKKQFYVVRHFTDKEVLDTSFIKEVIKTYKAMRPYFNYMSDVLTTDLNGESII